MPVEEFQMIMNTPPTPPAHYVVVPQQSAQMRFAYDENLNDIKRGIMIDRLTSRGTEPDLTPKLITLYKQTENIPVKEKIIAGLMIHYQHHLNLNKNTEEKQLLKQFFSEILYEKLTPTAANNTVRGFVDLHTPEDVMNNLHRINTLLTTVNHTSSIMLKYLLAYKSKVLEKIYMKSIINELRVADDADLDSYLFGPLSIGYAEAGQHLLTPDSKQIVVDYLKEVRYKYTAKGLQASPNDFHRSTTAPYYFELIKQMGLDKYNAQ